MVLLLNRDHPFLVQLGARVRALRKQRGWSRRDLAARTDISERFLADVEAGSANPSVLRLLTLAAAFELDLPSLLTKPVPDASLHIALLGLRGAGKSTVGPLLAARLGCPFVELDGRIEATTGLQIGEIFQMHGEAYYRATERSVLAQELGGPPAVLAVGGGLVTDPHSFSLLRSRARTVWLRAAPEEHWHRVLAQGDTRPMADNDRAFVDLRRILDDREPLYRLADVVVETSQRGVDEVVEQVEQALAAAGDPA
ncbi:MAG: helix-turn-helix domain-containing protein [Planctomycetes bacterium]|nr:helix-turn-helix domain-containing protein [Planctomycetota bacterium]MCB9883964.1 helix-turn-helix domain-containing protein [Planctomycetota bacterium]